MKKHNREELNYFGLSEQNLTPGDLYEQNIDREDLDEKTNAKVPRDKTRRKPGKRKAEEATPENTNDTAPESGEDMRTKETENIAQNYDNINPGDHLQSTADLWNNGRLIAKETIFTVVSRPKKVRKARKGAEDDATVDFIVEVKTLLDTGQSVAIRANMRSLKKLDNDSINDLDNDLKW